MILNSKSRIKEIEGQEAKVEESPNRKIKKLKPL
jgi:hypothetical protein